VILTDTAEHVHRCRRIERLRHELGRESF
jgi:hypothetical protein